MPRPSFYLLVLLLALFSLKHSVTAETAATEGLSQGTNSDDYDDVASDPDIDDDSDDDADDNMDNYLGDDDENFDQSFFDDDMMNGEDDFDGFGFKVGEIQELNANNIREMVSLQGTFIALYLHESTSENEKYETFFQSLSDFAQSDEFEFELGLGKIDQKETENLTSYWKPSKFPALVIFDNKFKVEYNGELDVDTFLKWLGPVVVREIEELKDKKDIEEFINKDKNPKVIAFYSKANEGELAVLNDLVINNYFAAIGIRKVGVCYEDCPNEYDGQVFARPSLVLFRSYENVKPYAKLDQNLGDDVKVYSFVVTESFPPVFVLDDINMTKVFDEKFKAQLILILDPKADNSRILKEFEKSSISNRENEQADQFSHAVYYNEQENDNIAWFFNLKSVKNFPKLFLTEVSGEIQRILKYESHKDGEIDLRYFQEFVEDYKSSKLPRYYVSEELPDNKDKLVKKLVGLNFEAEVMKSEDNYLVYVCSEDTKDICEQGLVKFEKFAEAATKQGNAGEVSLKFGLLDFSKNEIDVEFSAELPQVILFLNGWKTGPQVYEGNIVEEKAEELYGWVKDSISDFQAEFNKNDDKKKNYDL